MNKQKNGYTSWGLANWPEHIWPHTTARAKYLVRTHRAELMRVGALTRIGRVLVFAGDAYMRWLMSQSDHVTDFSIPPNNKKP